MLPDHSERRGTFRRGHAAPVGRARRCAGPSPGTRWREGFVLVPALRLALGPAPAQPPPPQLPWLQFGLLGPGAEAIARGQAHRGPAGGGTG